MKVENGDYDYWLGVHQKAFVLKQCARAKRCWLALSTVSSVDFSRRRLNNRTVGRARANQIWESKQMELVDNLKYYCGLYLVRGSLIVN